MGKESSKAAAAVMSKFKLRSQLTRDICGWYWPVRMSLSGTRDARKPAAIAIPHKDTRL